MIAPDEQHAIEVYVGIDNGVSGAVAILQKDGTPVLFEYTPVFECQDYTKVVKRIHRVDTRRLFQVLGRSSGAGRILLERPMVNPGRFTATASGLRAFEATLIVCESYGISPRIVDSKEWQKVMLPVGLKGDQLKSASRELGVKLFPCYSELINKRDADALLIAEYARRRAL